MSTTGNAISANVAASTTQTQSMQAPQPAAPEPPAQGSDQASSGAVSVHVPGSAPALSGTGAPTVTDTPRSMHDILNTSQPWYQSLANVSNLITFVVFLIGLLLVSLDDHVVFKYILATGLFGFAGGSTNWLAVKMLFDRIPFLYGSGVIPNKFKEIRRTVKDAIMITFFDPEFLQAYVDENAPKLIARLDLGTRLEEELAKPGVDAMIAAKLGEVAARGDQNGQLLMMLAGFMGGSFEAMVPKIKPVLVSFGHELVQKLAAKLGDGSFIDVVSLRAQIDALMTDKLRLLTPKIVKKLMEDVMRKHLGWLVLWGNVFGGLIGIVSQALGFGL